MKSDQADVAQDESVAKRLLNWHHMLILLILAAGLAMSIGAMFAMTGGFLLIVLSALWALAAGAFGARLQSWWWVIVCPSAMLGLVLLWEACYGPESWASMYVFILGAVYSVSAMVGSIPGVWLGRRRQAPAMKGFDTPR